ncbi:MAG: imidazoleglycerol-phosphate dehydratase HisB [Candidatus Micrarchaeota archaeon]|nr:imidazoleglycerol-phosphate dehydratase HisB [Candidatus Micrarchaeota archaeon]
MRTAKIERNTKETQIKVEINLDGTGKRRIETPVGFLDHMLDLFGKHGLFDIAVEAKGDMEIDEHHTVEDIGIVLGQALLKAVGDKKGIKRYGTMILPMDDVLALVSLDFAGRYAFVLDAQFTREKVGDLSTELIYDFFDAIAQNAKLNLHIKLLEAGRNDHHRIEGIFKAFARAVRQAVEIDERAKDQLPSTKGAL